MLERCRDGSVFISSSLYTEAVTDRRQYTMASAKPYRDTAGGTTTPSPPPWAAAPEDDAAEDIWDSAQPRSSTQDATHCCRVRWRLSSHRKARPVHTTREFSSSWKVAPDMTVMMNKSRLLLTA